MKHKHAELLHYAAEKADARFKCKTYGNANIEFVLLNSACDDWQIVQEPVVEVRYYVKSLNADFIRVFDGEEFVSDWKMKITITDGDIANAKVELR